MEAITAYLPIGGILLFVFFVLSSLHLNHLFIWMDPEVVAHDELIQNKREEKILTQNDLQQLFLSWDEETQQHLINAEKFCSLRLPPSFRVRISDLN